MRFALVLLLLASPAGADCLTTLDAGRGLAVAMSDGEQVEVWRGSDGMVTTSQDFGVFRLESLYAQGFWFVQDRAIWSDGQRSEDDVFRLLYEGGPEALPAIEAGLLWNGLVTPEVGGLPSRSNRLVVEAADGEPLEIDGCRYAALEVEVRVQPATEEAYTERHLYLTELGIDVLLEVQGGLDPLAPRDVAALDPLP